MNIKEIARHGKALATQDVRVHLSGEIEGYSEAVRMAPVAIASLLAIILEDRGKLPEHMKGEFEVVELLEYVEEM